MISRLAYEHLEQPEMLEGFEWDADKARSNLVKHRVAFEEAATIFLDPCSITIYDPDHSDDEDRFVTTGMSDRGRILTAVHVDRGRRIRIISARRAVASEKAEYAKGHQ